MSDPATDSAARLDPRDENRSRRRVRLRGLTVTAAAAVVLFGGGAAIAAADTGGDESGGSSTPSSSAPSGADPSTVPASPDAAPSPGDGGPAAGVHSPHLDGDVISVGSGSILITDHDGFTRTINVTANTTYGDGISVPIESGEHIHAEGTVDTDGTSLAATLIAVAPEPPTPADGSMPVPPVPPADGSRPVPPGDGILPTPAPTEGGDLPTPPADAVAPSSSVAPTG